jgi:beta-lactamase regulating signal transducer with metallopeptidase domain
MTVGIDNLSTFVHWLGTASWQASVIIILVLLIHMFAGRWLTPRWRLALWSVVFIRLLMPVPPASEWSIFNLTQRAPMIAEVFSEPAAVITPSDTVMPAPVAMRVMEPPWSLWNYAALAWLCGAIGVGLFMLIVALRLSRRLAVLPDVDDARLQPLLAEARTTMHLRRAPRIVIDPRAPAPALFGLLRPTLVLPPGLIARLDDQQLRHVLLHEFAHLRRRDLLKNWLLIAMTALHWFNPLIWLAFARYRADREMVCDAMVLSRLSPDESKPYGQTLIHVLEQIATAPRLPMMVGIGESFAQLKRRIIAIARFGKLSRFSAVVGVLALLILAATTLTGAADEEQPRADDGQFIVASGDEIDSNASPDAVNFDAQRQLERARDLYQQRKYHEALAVVDEVLANEPDNFTARMMRDMIAPHAQAQYELSEETARKLDSVLPVNFDRAPLSGVFDWIGKEAGLTFYVNWLALEHTGVERDMPITLQLTKDPSVAELLELVLREASPLPPLAYAVHDDMIKVSTARELKLMVVESHIYDMRDVFNTFDAEYRDTAVVQILDLVRNVGHPGEWREFGGDISSVTELNGTLIVNTYPQNHKEILALLNSLRATRLLKVSIEATALFVPVERIDRIDGIRFEQPIDHLDDIDAAVMRRVIADTPGAAVLDIPPTMLLNGRSRDTHRGMDAQPIDDHDLYGLNLKSKATVDALREWVRLQAQAYVINVRDAQRSGPLQNVWKFDQVADVTNKATVAFTSPDILPRFTMIDEQTGEPMIDVRNVRVVMLIKPTIIVPNELEPQLPGTE